MTESSLPEESIFMQALEIQSAPERAAYLDRACGEDRELRAAVEALLRANDKSGDLLDLPEKRGGTVDEPAVSEHPGTVIGPYKLLQQIGEGGMGTVFMAEQAQPVQRKVALKIIKSGMDSHQVIARFEAERQALALMDHPNIARVLEAGTTNSGRPYFVMDLVKGVPITRYCDEHHLTLRERLELFVPVCQAIQHAHQKGIIHRDIKPSNVLVALYDGKPVPKVIDFGVAKAAGPRLTERTLFTEFGQVVGTLEYMSPEQAELNQLDIDTRSDIYSLGVLLYELLTGTTPLEKKRIKVAAILEVLRLVREEEPPRPSTRLSTTEELPSIAANRGLEPKKLSGLMRGELDWIVMKALEKDRNRRYETANGFAADVRRYLNDEPVQACPPSAGYRLQKFVRRNKGPVLAASMVLLALLLGTAVSVWQAVAATDARQLADNRLVLADERLVNEKQARTNEARERTKAEKAVTEERKAREVANQRRRQAEATADLLESLFSNLNPDAEEKDGTDLKERLTAKLDEAAAQLEGEAADPLTQARLQSAIGAAFLGLGEATKGIVHFKRALENRQKTLGADHLDTITSMGNLAVAYQVAGQHDLALPLFDQSLEKRKAKLGFDHADTLISMHRLAVAYRHTGQLAKGLPLLEETLEKERTKLGPDHRHTLHTMNSLAVAYQAAGKIDLALPLFEQTLEKKKAKLGPDHPSTLVSMANLAGAYKAAGSQDLALSLFEQTLEKRKAKLGPDHPATLSSMNHLATAYRAAGKLDLALDLYKETLARRQAKLGYNDIHTRDTMYCLEATYKALGKIDLALDVYKQTVDKQKATLGPDHPDTLTSMHYLAVAYSNAGKLDLAIALHTETLEKRQAKLGFDHRDTLHSMTHLAVVYRAAKMPDRALAVYERALEEATSKLGAGHPATLTCMNHLAEAYWFAGKRDLALPLYEQTLERRKARPGPDHADTLNSMVTLAWAYQNTGKRDLALPLLEQALEKMNATGHAGTLNCMNLLADAYRFARKYELALPLFEKKLEMTRARHGPDSAATFLSMRDLARAYQAAGKVDRAVPLFEQYLKHKKTEPSPDPSDTLNALRDLANAYQAAGKFDLALEKMKAMHGPDHASTIVSTISLAAAYRAAGKRELSEQLLAKLAQTLEQSLEKTELKQGPEHPDTLNLMGRLAGFYKEAGKLDREETLLREVIKRRMATPRNALGPQLALGQNLLTQRKYTEAEPVLRAYVTSREKNTPPPYGWAMHETKSLLGAALVGQKKYADAEPLLLAGYEGLKKMFDESKDPRFYAVKVTQAVERLVQLYDAWGQHDKVDAWRQKLQAQREADKKTAKPKEK